MQNQQTLSSELEKKLWKTADKLRKNIDAAEYKHVVLGLIFLKYISDAFEELREVLVKGDGKYEGADPEDRDEYKAENVFFVPKTARWSYLKDFARQPEIGKFIDDAMVAIEKENPSLKGVLPKVYARPNIDKTALGGLIDLIGTALLGTKEARSHDVLGRVYEYFIGQFALAEGRKGGQFYTPKSVVRVLVEMLQPYEGRVFDPCCGSGGMFVQSDKFIESHAGTNQKKGNGLKLDLKDRISIYGQESNQTTWRLCKMNLAIRQIDSSNVLWNNEGSFLNDAHPYLKSDFVLANPPFNDSDWAGELLRDDARWQYGAPPEGNANFAWVQHFIYHLAPAGAAGFVLSNGSLSSMTGGEGEIRRRIIEDDLVDCVVMLPDKLFLNTGISACLWFLSRYKNGNKNRERKGEVLFIDASEIGYMETRRLRNFADEDIARIADTYHEWKKEGGDYEDIKGFCKSASVEEIKKHNFVLTPGRYVGIPDEEDDLPAPRPGVFFAYVIACEGGSYYIGQTDNLQRRWEEHVSGKSADWTKRHKPRYIHHYEEYNSREEAVAREKELKTTSGRTWIKKAIKEGRARQAGGVPFEDKMAALTAELKEQMTEGEKLDAEIKKQLAKIGFEL